MKRKRLQGREYHKRKAFLNPINYSQTRNGNICIYYEGGYYHYLNDEEKKDFKEKRKTINKKELLQ